MDVKTTPCTYWVNMLLFWRGEGARKGADGIDFLFLVKKTIFIFILMNFWICA